jgi:hypothetical protein
MTIWIKTIPIIVALLLIVVPARAGEYATSAETFIAEYDKGGEVKIYAQGLVDGLGVYRAAVGPRIFCPPTGLDMTLDQVVDIMRKHMVERPNVKSMPARVVMLGALGNAFPCK